MPRFVTGWPDAQTIPLAGLQPGTDLSAHPLRGPLFETYLLQNLASILGDHLPEAHILHYRSHAGHEVDFIIETPGAVLAIEAKAAATVDARDVHLDRPVVLRDARNNPLAIISVSSQTLHRKHEGDSETIGWLDRIDAALQRVHSTINDIKAYQAQKIVQESMTAVDGVQPKPVDVMAKLSSLANAKLQMTEGERREEVAAGNVNP